jgi:L-seryl-tRNA(Ser) seleniumtransferase
MTDTLHARLRGLPKVGELLEGALGRRLLAEAPRWAVLAALREEVEAMRRVLAGGGEARLDEARVRAGVLCRTRPTLERVINATGVVLHTNLGRAPLAEAAIERLVEVARGYSNLEYRVDERRRGSRHDHAAALLCELSGAEAALVVNNCAAAVMLALLALARGREVLVSRGELVEIGGGFRVPDVMAQSGAILVELGTTNRTRLDDYARALDAHAGARLLMKVHRSNFAIVGFTEEASVAELAALGRARGLPLFVDLGAGAMAPLAGLPAGAAGPEPTVPELIRAGADLVAFSGDKLLGGPQAGLLVGKRALIEEIAHHPVMRALRPDKLTLAALEGTLSLHRDGRAAEVPALAMLTTPEPTLEARARALAGRLATGSIRAEAVRVRSMIGGGALPTVEPWSWAVRMEREGRSADALEAALRGARPPVIGRIADGALLLDVRTVSERDLPDIERAIAAIEGGAEA